MTNREALIDSMTLIDMLPDDAEGELLKLPLPFGDFIMGMTTVVLGAVLSYLKHDFPVVKAYGSSRGGGKAVDEEPTVQQVLDVLLANDLPRGLTLSIQLREFLEWWLDREAKEMFSGGDDDTNAWFDIAYLNDEWNRYAKEASYDQRQR